MAESDKDNKPRVIVGSQKSKPRRLFNRYRKLIWLVILIIIIGGVGYYGYHKHQADQKNAQLQNSYTSGLLKQSQIVAVNQPQPQSELNQQIQTLQQQIAKAPTWQAYVSLGSLYANAGNKQKAVAEYQLAKKYVPKDGSYQANINSIDLDIGIVQEK